MTPPAPKFNRHANRPPLEWSGPLRITRDAWRHRYRAQGRPWPNMIRLANTGWRLSPDQVAIVQAVADGHTREEIAKQIHLCPESVTQALARARRKLGAHSTAETVAQALKRGYIRPDTATARRVEPATWRRHHVNRHLAELRRLVAGDLTVTPRGGTAARHHDALWDIRARTIPHAVSIAWAARQITSRHVPQTRSRYRPDRRYTTKETRQ